MTPLKGRVADSITARFLSADPDVSDPTNTRRFNRYRYVNNNPISLSDKTGFDDVGSGGPEPGDSTDLQGDANIDTDAPGGNVGIPQGSVCIALPPSTQVFCRTLANA